MTKKDILILKGDRPNTEETGSYFTWKNLSETGPDNYVIEQYSDIIFSIINGEVRAVSAITGRDVSSYDLVYIRDITHEQVRNAIGLYLSHRKKHFINYELARSQYTSKLLQYIAFADAGLQVPNTVYADRKHLDKAFDLLGGVLPVVIKSTTGSNGNDNFLVRSSSELHELPITSEFVMQTYIDNQFDYRFVVAEDVVLIAYKRLRGGGDNYRNNISQGGKRELVETITPELSQTAVLAAKTLSRNLSGVDILVDETNGQPYVLEVNFNYGTPRFEAEITNEYFVKLADYLHKKASSES
jgi:glutathione synthase/RimK-type ligase-like ATP-grasp enzyme